MKNSLPLNSIVVPIYLTDFGSVKMVDQVLEHLLIQKKQVPIEIIVVDDCSLNQCGVKILKNKYHRVAVFLKMKNRSGLVRSLNTGALSAKGDILTYCHSDCFVKSGSLKNVAETFKDVEIGMVISNLFYANSTLQQSGGWINHDFKLSWSKRISQIPTDVHWGDFWTVRSSLLKKIGLLDEKYGIGYWECVDLATEIRMLDFRVVTCPMSRVIHFHGTTFKYLFSKDARNSLYETGRHIFKNKWINQIDSICNGITEEIEDSDWK